MSRAHLFRPVTNSNGTPLYGAKITVRESDLGSDIAQTIWNGPLDTALSVENPVVANAGFLDMWLDMPQRVNLLVQYPGAPDVSIFVDVNAAADEVAITDTPLRIINMPYPNSVLLGVDEETAQFGDPPVQPAAGAVPVHQHPGDGADSTCVGTSAAATGLDSTAFGVGAQATADYTTAVGTQAQATVTRGTAVGTEAQVIGEDGTAIGYQAQSIDGGAAVGSGSQVSGLRGTAVGSNSQAQAPGGVSLGSGSRSLGQDAVAIGDNSLASGADAVALGANTSAQFDRSVAIGNGVSADSADQVKIGQAGSSVLVPGQFVGMGAMQIAGGGENLGFFGSYGVPQQVVTGSDGGDLVLRQLIQYLAQLGLIVDNTTQG